MQRQEGISGNTISSESKDMPPVSVLVAPSAPALSPDEEADIALPQVSQIGRRQVQVAPILPVAPVVMDPDAEGYDAKAHKEYLDKLWDVAHKTQRQVEILNERHQVLMRMEFKEKHKSIAKYSEKVSFVNGYWDDFTLIYRALMGGALADQVHKNQISTEFTVLLEVYILLNLIMAFTKSAGRSVVNYAGVTRRLEEELARKGILSAEDFRLLASAPSVWIENLLNSAAVGLIVTGAVYLGRSGGFDSALFFIGSGMVAEVGGSILNMLSKRRFAEEIRGLELDEGSVYRSRTYTRADRAGKFLLGSGAVLSFAEMGRMVTNHDSQLSNLGLSAFFVTVAGFMSVGSLAPRALGSDFINHVIDELELGKGTDRLKSLFLGCKSSRSDVDDFLSASVMTCLMGMVAVAIDKDTQIGYLAAAACGLAGFYLFKGQAHVSTLSIANELSFWKSAQSKHDLEAGKPAAALAESKAASKALEEKKNQRNEEEDCPAKVHGCLGRVANRFYKWMTKSETSCSAPVAEHKNLLRR